MTPLEQKDFRALVDQALVTPMADEADVLACFEPILSGHQPADRRRAITTAITGALASGERGEPGRQRMRRLARSLAFEAALGEVAEPYITIARTLAGLGGDEPWRDLNDQGAWLTAIQMARAAEILSPRVDFPNLRLEAVTAAAGRLSAAGYTLEVIDGSFHMPPGDLDRLCRDIDRRIGLLGGRGVLEHLCGILKDHEPWVLGRVAPGRLSTPLPSVPYGYLFQLAVRRLGLQPTRGLDAGEVWRTLYQDVTDLCATIDIEPYSNLENIAPSPWRLPEWLGSIALFDHLFALRQWPPSKAVGLLTGALRDIDLTSAEAALGWTLEDVVRLMEATILQVGPMPTHWTLGQIRALGFPEAVWSALERDFVHAAGSFSLNYLTPGDAGRAEMDFKPFFALPGAILAVTPALAAFAFYEATTRAIRNTRLVADFDGQVGHTIEAVVAEALRAKGFAVTVQGLKYSEPGGPISVEKGECDVVVETDELIILIEMKKKPLRRVSMGGDAVAGLVDLSTSLFEAQAQLARHEHHLLTHGRIVFHDGSILEHRGRGIERIAMTWLDYGGLQDKTVLDKVFQGLMGREISAPGLTRKTAEAFADLNAHIAALSREAEALVELGKIPHALFINCWFFSVPQLLMIIDDVETPQALVKRLSTLRHMSFQTLDLYRDFAMARRSGLV